MTPRRLPAPWGALAALGLAALIPALAWVGIVQPLSARRAALEARIADAGAQLARFAATLAEPVGEAAPQPPKWAAFDAGAPLLATAELQRRLDAAVEAAGGTRRAAQPLEPASVDGAARLVVVVDADFDPQALRDFLQAVEAARPLMIIERLEAQRRDGSLADDAEAGDVSLRATVVAYSTVAGQETAP